MFRRIFAALDRLTAAINGLAEKFELADRELSDRLAEVRPASAALECAAEGEPVNGTARKAKAAR
jgi:hypothetical protein